MNNPNDDLLIDEEEVIAPGPREDKLKITRVVSVDGDTLDEAIETHKVSLHDVRKAIEYWVSKQPIPDITDKLDGIIVVYGSEKGFKRKEPPKDELGGI